MRALNDGSYGIISVEAITRTGVQSFQIGRNVTNVPDDVAPHWWTSRRATSSHFRCETLEQNREARWVLTRRVGSWRDAKRYDDMMRQKCLKKQANNGGESQRKKMLCGRV